MINAAYLINSIRSICSSSSKTISVISVWVDVKMWWQWPRKTTKYCASIWSIKNVMSWLLMLVMTLN